MKYWTILLLFTSIIWLGACNDDTENFSDPFTRNIGGEWIIPQELVFDGGPGKDGIPSIDNPNFVGVSEVNFDEEELVVGMKIGDEVRAYPHFILDWHEIVNDELSGVPVAMTYCPLTGTALAWDRRLSTGETTFGVSGLLYNTNLLPYDRLTDSYWSQMLSQSVNGEIIREKAQLHRVVETSWKTWKTLYPNSKVLSTNTGFQRTYGRYPYGSYQTDNNQFLFPITRRDARVPNKERTHGIHIAGSTKVYRFADFPDTTHVIEDEVGGVPIVVVGNSNMNFIVSYSRSLEDGTSLSFTPVQDKYPIVMRDEVGNEWDIFGEAVSDENASLSRKGQRLRYERSLMGMWFVFPAFYNDVTLYTP